MIGISLIIAFIYFVYSYMRAIKKSQIFDLSGKTLKEVFRRNWMNRRKNIKLLLRPFAIYLFHGLCIIAYFLLCMYFKIIW